MADERDDFEQRSRELAGEQPDAEELKFEGVDRALVQHDRRLADVEKRLDTLSRPLPPAPPTSSASLGLALLLGLLGTAVVAFYLSTDRRPPLAEG